MATGRQLRVLRGESGANLSFSALAFSPDGRQLPSGNKDGAARLWEVTIPPAAAHGWAKYH